VNRLAAVVLAVLSLSAASVRAQAYPARPIQVISAASLGSAGDIAIRLLASRMAANVGQQVVVETRGGAGGALAATGVMRAAPDGHTLLYATPNILVHGKFMVKNQPFDTLKDFSPISLTIAIPIFLAVSADLPFTSVPGLVEYAKRNPGRLAHGSTGVGTPQHLLGESLKIRTGIDMLHVPYSATGGAVTAINDVASGRLHMYFPTYTAIRPYLAPNDKVRVLAIFHDTRFRHAPSVPAITELVPDFGMIPAYYGLLGPAAMPRPIVDRLNAESRKVWNAPETVGKMDDLGITPLVSTPEEFTARIRADMDYIGKLLATMGIKPD
jgi:tripartite-type tricarboxylate transporter receptor subunit TctC